MTRTTEAIIATQWGTFLWSAIGILLMLTLAFRSLSLAVLAILPTLLSVALVLGLMGWLRIKLDMATALVASVALGLSVDDTFHCLLQFHRDAKTMRFRRRLFDSYRVSGPGVFLSSLAVADRLRRASGQRVRAVRQLRDHGRHRDRRQHAGQPGLAARLPHAGPSLAREAEAAQGGKCGESG